ncbi:MAG: IS110 family transposase [Betaproteobacteria bacterium]|nr:MAG: IS110 family transposase [Betaproteobacteria bacterium]
MDTTFMRQAKQATDRQLFIAFELAQRHWRLAFGDGVGRARLVTLEAGDQVAVKEAIAKARIHFGLDEAAAVVSCYEAGRDGFWLHRWLLECGVENLIVDSGSIEVNRRQRRAKTDRLDALKLLSMLMRYMGGERRVWTVLHVPTTEQEDARRPHRERERLERERLAHSNRIRGLLMLHNIRVKTIGGAKWCQRLAALRVHLPVQLWAELGRESERLRLVVEQLRALEAERAQSLIQADPAREKTVKLLELVSIGPTSAWVLAREVFWRTLRNRREVAHCAGLAPMPYASGESAHEQGISKAGNRRVRVLTVQLAWCWLRYQPQSALAQWFNVRFAGGGSRIRRIGIVALARRLLIALWRYVEYGVIPEGATLKTRTV